MITKHKHTDKGSINGVLGRLEAQANVLVPSPATLARSAGLGLNLGVEENMRLLLESTLRLNGEFGSHLCGRDRLAMLKVTIAGGDGGTEKLWSLLGA